MLVLWTLPFVWIGVSMSVRRAARAGLSPWLGLGFLLPFLNYLFMIGLAILPDRNGEEWGAHPVDREVVIAGCGCHQFLHHGFELLRGESKRLGDNCRGLRLAFVKHTI